MLYVEIEKTIQAASRCVVGLDFSVPCYYPKDVWRSASYNEKGKRPLLFKYSADCAEELQIPCGQCIGCRLERSRQWAMRCVHESTLHDDNSFITLTYSPENLPENGSLKKSDFQKFMKRYRKRFPEIKIRYYMCGEYGENLRHPHYHAIIFGHDFADKWLFKDENGSKLYRSPTLEKLWPYGYSLIGSCTFESAAYVARYVTKKMNGDVAQEHYKVPDLTTGELVEIIPEYTAMSRRPGIAAGWYEKYSKDTEKDFVTLRGRKMLLPKFYDRLLEKADREEYELRKEGRQESARVADKTNASPDRLRVREKVQRIRAAKLKRGYESEK